MNSRAISLNSQPPATRNCVIYLMSRDQRVHDNHALLYAQQFALQKKLPLVVAFNLMPKLGVRAREHFEFMLDGLKLVEKELAKFNIPMVLTVGDMSKELSKLSEHLQPGLIVCDFNPLRGPREAQKSLAKSVNVAVHVVDAHNIVPVWSLSDKQEFAAHTIRRKLHKQLEQWLKEPDAVQKHPYAYAGTLEKPDWKRADALVGTLVSCGISHGFTPGEMNANKKLAEFISNGLARYSTQRNDPAIDVQSSLSPYLHFGQLSSLRIVLDIIHSTKHAPLLLREPKMPQPTEKNNLADGVDAFIEELVVRKELSDNYCFYNASYDSLAGAPDWARKTLTEHASDPREHMYTPEQFEQAKTHDALWNAAQNQLRRTGKIHGYMRMYWAKKILEWSSSPEEAIKTAVFLNDHYSLDGGDPNGYVGILWSVAGLHDRPWFNRSIYGTIRYMSAGGLAKKFDTKAYEKKWN